MINAYISFWKKAFDFKGTTNRSDYWLGLVTFGEGFHAKHHDEPWSWNFHPWDIGGKIIRLLKHA